jgi:hypothetical protein
MSINGIPVRIKTEDADGKLTQVETIYFPTFRKCPKLAQFPKVISKLETQIAKARRKIAIAEEALATASIDEVDKVGESLDAAKDALMDLDKKTFAQFDNFVTTGLKAAGYQDSDVERYMPYIDMGRLEELIQCSRFGAGRVDFFTEENPPQQS